MLVIVVAAAVLVFVYATGLFAALARPQSFQSEALSLEFSSFGPVDPSHNVTLFLRNTGTVPVTLASYYVKSNSSQYANSAWAGQASIPPTGLGRPQVLISAACSCTNTGGTFTYTVGISYTITLVSTKGSYFTFNVVRYS